MKYSILLVLLQAALACGGLYFLNHVQPLMAVSASLLITAYVLKGPIAALREQEKM